MLSLIRAEECSICLDILEENEKKLPCSHIFHKACIDKWLERSNRCPLCMGEIEEKTFMHRVTEECCIRVEGMNDNENDNRRIYINRLCVIMCMILCAVILIILLEIWNRNQ